MCGDIEKAFLQIRIRESERDALRFHWVKNSDPSIIEINRFTRLVFGLNQSLFILEGTLKGHFQYYINEYPTFIEALSKDMYVDDLVSGSNTIKEVEVIKHKSETKKSYFENAGLICIRDTQIYRHYNPPLQSLKVNLPMPKKNLKTQPILQKY